MSKLLFRKGSRWTSATTDVAGTSLAWSSMAGERSAIVTFASGQILLTWRERAPLPLPASDPGARPQRCSEITEHPCLGR